MTSRSQLEEVTWPEVRTLVGKVNPEIANHIDGIKPKQRHPLFLAKYNFGEHMVEKGVLMLPSKRHQIVPFYDNEVMSSARNLLSYCSIPLSLWLNSHGEVYIEMDERVIPLNVFSPGSICGLWEALDMSASVFSKRIWNIAVGARSFFMLPKISDASSFKRLEKKYDLRATSIPKSIFDHAKLFSQLVRSESSKIAWDSDILFFSKGWLNECFNEKNWLAFHYTLLRDEWRRSIYWRNKVTFSLIGQMFAMAQSKRNLKASPHLIDTVMYLISIGVGASPSFEPAFEEETCGPIRFIQESITQDYGLKSYIPTMMRPNYLAANNQPVYYSMQWPTMLGSSPQVTKPQSVLDDMRMVKRLLESLSNILEISQSPIFDLIKGVEYDFFHTEAEDYSGIKGTWDMPSGDPRLISCHDQNRRFCENSSFLRGCVRITKREQNE